MVPKDQIQNSWIFGIELVSWLRETHQGRGAGLRPPPFLICSREPGNNFDSDNYRSLVYIFLHHLAQHHFTGTQLGAEDPTSLDGLSGWTGPPACGIGGLEGCAPPRQSGLGGSFQNAAGANVKVSRKSRRVPLDLRLDPPRGRILVSILTSLPPVAGVRASILHGVPFDLSAAVPVMVKSTRLRFIAV